MGVDIFHIFPKLQGRGSLPKGAWRRQHGSMFTPLFFQILRVRKPFQGSLDAPTGIDVYPMLFQILGVRKFFPKELGCPNIDQFLHNCFPDSRGEEALPKGAWMSQQSIFTQLFSRF